ncbi:MAG: EAL domain-containing protein [Anaeroplasmataceae bacterium]
MNLSFISFLKNINVEILICIFIVLVIIAILVFIIFLILVRSKKKNAELRELDYLTKIYNRSYYYKQCKRFLENTNSMYAMIAFDINKFKLVNEYYGTDAADTILIQIADKLLDFYKEGRIKIFGRIESDKFSWIMPASKDKIKDLFEDLDQIRINSKYSIAFSIGVYFIEYNKMDVEQAYSRANIAVKTIKNNFDSSIAYFDKEMIAKLEKEQFYVNSLDEAILNEEILVYFQPKYDLQQDMVGGAEALVRWNHPKLGMIPPSEFVPALENNGLITKIDKFIWERTAKYLSEWRSKGLTPPPVSVNISKMDLLEKGLPDYIENLVRKYSIPHNLLELEITESAYVDGTVDVVSIIKEFKSKGFTILMDDFGSGYSSLNTLRQFEVDVLKIDLKFLSGFDNSNETVKGKTIIESIVTMAHQLGLKIVVEGTETIEQVEYIKSIGCEMAQGYYFSKPIKALEYVNMFTNGNKLFQTKAQTTNATDDSVWSKNIITDDFFNSTTSALGIFIYRRDRLEAVRLNERYFEIIETPRKEFYLKSRNVLDNIYPSDLDNVLNNINECIRNKSSVLFEYRRLNNTGNIKWLRCRMTYVNNQDISVNYFFVSIDDITSEHRAILDRDELLNSFEYGFIKCDLDTNKILLYNNKLLEILQIEENEFISSYIDDYMSLFSLEDLEDFNKSIEDLAFNDTIKIYSCFKTKKMYINVIIIFKRTKVDNKNYGYLSIIKNYEEN